MNLITMVQKLSHEQVQILDIVDKDHIRELKILDASSLTTSYENSHYNIILKEGGNFLKSNGICWNKLARVKGSFVGAITCRVLSKSEELESIIDDDDTNNKWLYILSMAILPQFRRKGVGTILLNHIFLMCERDPQIKLIYLHVQTNNEGALDFYKSLGFEVVGLVENYYKRIEPNSAHILKKIIN